MKILCGSCGQSCDIESSGRRRAAWCPYCGAVLKMEEAKESASSPSPASTKKSRDEGQDQPSVIIDEGLQADAERAKELDASDSGDFPNTEGAEEGSDSDESSGREASSKKAKRRQRRKKAAQRKETASQDSSATQPVSLGGSDNASAKTAEHSVVVAPVVVLGDAPPAKAGAIGGAERKEPAPPVAEVPSDTEKTLPAQGNAGVIAEAVSGSGAGPSGAVGWAASEPEDDEEEFSVVAPAPGSISALAPAKELDKVDIMSFGGVPKGGSTLASLQGDARPATDWEARALEDAISVGQSVPEVKRHEPERVPAPSPLVAGQVDTSDTIRMDRPPEIEEAAHRQVPIGDVDEDRFFSGNALGASSIDPDVAEDMRPVRRSGNKTFLVIALVVGLAVLVVLLYLVLRKPSSGAGTPKTGSAGPVAPKRVAVAPPSATPVPAAPRPASPEAPVAPTPAKPDPTARPAEPLVRHGSARTAQVVAAVAARPHAFEAPPAPRPRKRARRRMRKVARKEPAGERLSASGSGTSSDPRPAAADDEPAAPAPAPAAAPEPPPDPLTQRARGRIRLGQVLLSQGRFSGAISEFRGALRIGREVAAAHRSLGRAYAGLGRSSRAVRHYRAYLRLRPNAADRTVVEETIQSLGGGR